MSDRTFHFLMACGLMISGAVFYVLGFARGMRAERRRP